MPSPNKKVLHAYLTAEEYGQVAASAAKAGLSISTFVKRVCLGNPVDSLVDQQAVLLLIKSKADLGRLGGLFKMALSEEKYKDREQAAEFRSLLRSIEKNQEKLAREYSVLVRQMMGKK